MSKLAGRDLKACLNFKRRNPHLGARGTTHLAALPGESLKAFARRTVREGHHDAEWSREWLRRKGCRT